MVNINLDYLCLHVYFSHRSSLMDIVSFIYGSIPNITYQRQLDPQHSQPSSYDVCCMHPEDLTAFCLFHVLKHTHGINNKNFDRIIVLRQIMLWDSWKIFLQGLCLGIFNCMHDASFVCRDVQGSTNSTQRAANH